MLQDGAKVLVNDRFPGTVVGRGFKGSEAKYLVELDEGFWADDEQRLMYISTIVADPSSVTAVAVCTGYCRGEVYPAEQVKDGRCEECREEIDSRSVDAFGRG